MYEGAPEAVEGSVGVDADEVVGLDASLLEYKNDQNHYLRVKLIF